MVTLTDYQARAYPLWKANGCRAIISAATGSGKTILGCECIRRFREDHPNVKTIVVTTSTKAVKQWEAELANFGIDDVEVYTYGKAVNKMHRGDRRTEFRTPDGTVDMFLSFDTADEITDGERVTVTQEYGLKCGLLVADECHHLTTPAHGQVMNMDPFFVLGLSATPEDSVNLLGDPIDTITVDEARVCPFMVHMVKFQPWKEEAERYDKLSRAMVRRARKVTGSVCHECGGSGTASIFRDVAMEKANVCASCNGTGYAGGRDTLKPGEDAEGWDSYDALVRRRREVCYTFDSRIPLTVKLVKKHFGERIVIFTERTEHAHKIADALTYNGIACSMNVKDKNTMKDFEQGKTNVLVMVKSLREAWDDPTLSVCIMASLSTRPKIMTQTMGRTMRIDPDNPDKHAHNYLLIANGTSDHRVKGSLDYPKDRFKDETPDTLFGTMEKWT